MELESATWYWITDPREGDTWYPIFAQSTKVYIMDGKQYPASNLKELTVVKAEMPE